MCRSVIFSFLGIIYLTMTSCSNTENSLIKKKLESSIKWAIIPKGEFMMGSPLTEPNRKENETQHHVIVDSFKMSKYEITVGQFKAFIDATGYITDAEKKGGGVSGSAIWSSPYWIYHEGVNWRCDEKGVYRSSKQLNYPVIHVSWNDANAFAEWLGCRLPSEAEWEYSCRAGTLSPYNTGDNISYSQANFAVKPPCVDYGKCDSLKGILPVGNFSPNSWGLYDMHGNVWEWCSDTYSEYPGSNCVVYDSLKLNRVARGGCWYNPAKSLRSAKRGSRNPAFRCDDVGFRIAKNI